MYGTVHPNHTCVRPALAPAYARYPPFVALLRHRDRAQLNSYDNHGHTLAKINAGFLGLFMVQCLWYVPLDSNFVGITLDFEDLFIMRCFGISASGSATSFSRRTADETFLAVLMCAFGLAGPIYAQLYMPVKLPEHCAPHATNPANCRPARPECAHARV